MTAAIQSNTSTYKFNLINFDFPRWGIYEQENWSKLDAILTALSGGLAIKGYWTPDTVYHVGDTVVDGTTSPEALYVCYVSHTSGDTTFVADRIAHATYWVPRGSVPVVVIDPLTVLLRNNNLGDLTNVSIALSNLGAGTIGVGLFAVNDVATALGLLGAGIFGGTLFTSSSSTQALNLLGVTAFGINLVTSADAPTARALLGVDQGTDLALSYAQQAAASATSAANSAAAATAAVAAANSIVVNGSVNFTTQALLFADSAPAIGTGGYVWNDGANNGFYIKTSSGPTVWTKQSNMTLAAIDAATLFCRTAIFDPGDGASAIMDQEGTHILEIGPSGVSALQITALTSFNLTGTDATQATISPNMDVPFEVFDSLTGNVLAAIHPVTGNLLVKDVQTVNDLLTGDYKAAEIASRSARALALTREYMSSINTSTTSPNADWNIIIIYGQSLGNGHQGYPAKTKTIQTRVWMLGQSIRPTTELGSTFDAVGGANVLTPHVACTQDRSTGAILSDAAVSALAVGTDDLGESLGDGGSHFFADLFEEYARLRPSPSTTIIGSATGPQFIVVNCATGGQPISTLSKGAGANYYNKMVDACTKIKALATTAGKTCQLLGTVFAQGNDDYLAFTSFSTYLAAIKQLQSDINSDISTGLFSQKLPAAFVMTETTGVTLANDDLGLSVSMAQLQASIDNPTMFVACPEYQAPDHGVHMAANGYRQTSLFLFKALFDITVRRIKVRPVIPLQGTYRGRTALIDWHCPTAPLQFKISYTTTAGVYNYPLLNVDRGISFVDSSGTIPITSVQVVGDACTLHTWGRNPNGPVTMYNARYTTDVGTSNLYDSTSYLTGFTFDYSAGSGDYVEDNIAEFVGLPYFMNNASAAYKLLLTAN